MSQCVSILLVYSVSKCAFNLLTLNWYRQAHFWLLASRVSF